ncbi:858_t:CDS:1, partial [Acaulospora morrowiae]
LENNSSSNDMNTTTLNLTTDEQLNNTFSWSDSETLQEDTNHTYIKPHKTQEIK